MTNQESLEQKVQMIKDRVELAVNGYVNGFYLWGEGGIGKSFSILTKLEDLKQNYVLHNTRISARAFFDSICKAPGAVHVIEECEDIFTDRQGMNLLRSACWGQKDKTGKQKRIITWNIAPEAMKIEFTGSILFTGNRALGSVPELRALKTRIPSLQLEVSRDEMLDLMRRIASKGYKNNKGELSKAECMEVYNFYAPKDRLDLRILVRAFDEVMGCRELGLKTDWRVMIESAITESLVASEPETKRTLEEIAVELFEKKLPGPQLEAEWKTLTGKGLRTYYRALKTMVKQ